MEITILTIASSYRCPSRTETPRPPHRGRCQRLDLGSQVSYIAMDWFKGNFAGAPLIFHREKPWVSG
jgi:hypothetical protein